MAKINASLAEIIDAVNAEPDRKKAARVATAVRSALMASPEGMLFMFPGLRSVNARPQKIKKDHPQVGGPNTGNVGDSNSQDARTEGADAGSGAASAGGGEGTAEP